MKPAIVSIPLDKIMQILLDTTELSEAKRLLRESIIYNEKDKEDLIRPAHRPLKAVHPHINETDLLLYRDLLFVKLKISQMPEWAPDEVGNKKPKRFANDQSDMEPDTIRLDNGVVALLNLDLEGIDPQPMY